MKKKSIFKKVLAILMLVALCIGFIPSSALADQLPFNANRIPGGRSADLGTSYSGAGTFFHVGYGDGSYTEFSINSHTVTLNGKTYAAYCVHPFSTGPNDESGAESDPDFGDGGRVKTGIQAILDHGYPTVDGGRDWERYCTAFAISKWLAMNNTWGSDPVYGGWNNFKYSQEQYDYVNTLVNYASAGSIVNNGRTATYFTPSAWNKQTLVVNLEPDEITINLKKSSANPNITNGNGCYSLAGAVYGVYSDPSCTALVEKLTTDAAGNARSSQLPKETYYVKEISPSPGYLLDSRVYTVSSETGGEVALDVKEIPGNDPVGISITKITDDPATTLPSLEGTQFTIKFYGGQYSSVSELPAAPLRTWVIEVKARSTSSGVKYEAFLREDYKVSGDSFYEVDLGGNAMLPIGTLTVQETTPANGYTTKGGWVNSASGDTITAADGIVILNIVPDPDAPSGASISYNGALRYGNEYTKTDKPVYGGVRVQKLDAETGLATPQGGGSFSNTGFVVYSLNKDPITVGGEIVNYGEGINAAMGTSDENGLWEVPADVLPAGHYAVQETIFPCGYTSEGKTRVEFDIIEDGVIVDLSSLPNAIADIPIRADFSLLKQDGETKEAMANVRFSITSNTTGESHEFETDENGEFNSVESKLRFGAGNVGEGGALLYDTYTITELPCEANQGYTLAAPITLKVDGSAAIIRLEHVYNYEMRMKTSARFMPSREQLGLAEGTVKARDTVSYENLLPNTNYTLVGKAYSLALESFIAETENSFTTTARSGFQYMDFEFNADDLAGTDVVICEYLYLEGEDEPVLTHEDLADEEQMLHFPKIRTSAMNPLTGEHMGTAGEMDVVDTVFYENLMPGKEYAVYGTVVDAGAPETILGGALTVFTPEEENGSVDLQLRVNAKSFSGKTLVVFESILLNGNVIAVHQDAADADQSVIIPGIGTEALDAETGDHWAIADEKVTITDTVSYWNIIPGEEYSVVGQQILKSDPDKVIAEHEMTFIAEEQDGSVEQTFTFDGSMLAGDAVVAFETLYYNGVAIAVHADTSDEGQTVYFPGIKTSATVNGQKRVAAREKVSLIDVVTYSNLIPGESYTVVGRLVDSEAKSILGIFPVSTAKDANGKELTAETSFIAEKSSGSVQLTFEFNATNMKGKTLVVFDQVFLGDDTDAQPVAVHEDIGSEDQSVTFMDGGVQTGDNSNATLWIAFMIASAAGTAAIAIAMYRRKKTT